MTVIYQTKTLEGEGRINEWLLKMSKFKSFKAIAISVHTGAGWWFEVLYSIESKDLEFI